MSQSTPENPNNSDNSQPNNQNQHTNQNQNANIPEKFKGKSAEEIANSYIELEKKMTQIAEEGNLTKTQLKDLKAMQEFIDNDPESLQFLTQRVNARKPGKQVTTQNQDQDQPNPLLDTLKQDVSDTRLATQGQLIEKFEGKYGFDRMQDEGKTAIRQKIGNEIKAMLDPTGNKTVSQIIATIPLNSLPMYLEKAYQLATVDDDKERERRKALVQARQNSDAVFSSIPSSSLRTEDMKLSSEEKIVAKGLGIAEDKYLAQKKQMAEEYQQ